MANYVIEAGTATVVMTGIEFLQYGRRYLEAADHIAARPSVEWFDPLPYQLYCQSLELHLKAFVWLADRATRVAIKKQYGHDIEKLWRCAKERGVDRYSAATAARDAAIELLGPPYKARRFAYMDLTLAWEVVPRLRARPDALVTIARLCERLQTALHKPILDAS